MKIFILVPLLLFARFALGATGFYSGSFDPVTKAHESIIRAASQEPGVDKLFVLVNVSGTKNFNTSGWERVEMLRAALGDLGSRVEFLPVLQEAKEQKIFSLVGDAPKVSFIGEDSYQKLDAEALNRPNTRWVVFRRVGEDPVQGSVPSNVKFREVPGIEEVVSSTMAREGINGPGLDRILNPKVITLIRANAFYQPPVDAGLIDLEKALFKDAFVSFKTDLQRVFPHIDFKDLALPAFKETQSREGWAESFMRQALLQARLSPEASVDFWEKSQDLLFSFPRGNPAATLPFLEKASMTNATVRRAKAIEKFSLEGLDSKSFTMDIDVYSADRFPNSLRDFVNAHSAAIYLHDSFETDSQAFHNRNGFTKFYRIRLARELDLKTTLLAYNPTTKEYRLILTGSAAMIARRKSARTWGREDSKVR